MDYSAFAPARPPQAGYSHGAGLASDGRRAGAQDAPVRPYGPAELAGHFGSLDLSDPHSFDAFHPPNSSSSSSNARAPLPLSPPPGSSQAGSSYQQTQGLSNGYSAANRPRPQLSPGLGPLGGAFPPRSTSPLPQPGANDPNAPRIPRKSSLPPIPGQGGPSSASPLPPLPPSASSSSTQLHADSLGPRDSSGGEQVFNGAAIAAGASAGPSRADPQAGHAVAASESTASGNAALEASSSLKRANPLEDLIATETAYVEDLGAVIKRVAAAWSRNNFPPPALDAMFRAIEAVYRINKTLLAKLNEIGPNPSSPKALGDLLMRWVSDIEPAYTRYATTISLDFDLYDPVQSNPKLAPILASLPWPSSLPSPSSAVTMDRLFELPYYRVRYYKRLYAKLLRSTQEGRSDHALLVSANEKLAKLEEMCAEGRKRSVLGPGGREEVMRRRAEEEEERARRAQEEERAQVEQVPAPSPVLEQRIPAEDVERLASPPIERREVEQLARAGPPRLNLDLTAAANGLRKEDQQRSAVDSPRMESPSSSSSFRSSGATGVSTAHTSAVHAPSPNLSREPPPRVSELERRLNTERTLDIFTMKPRKCKLQMQPPNLAYQRQLRKASDAVLSFIPTSDPAQRQVRIPRAFVIILTDLFLVCEHVAPEELHLASGADLWLLYPPLAGKHLRVADGPTRGEIEVTIMNKERLTFVVEGGDEMRAKELKAAIEEATRFGTAQPRQNSTMSSGAGHSPISPTAPNSALSSSFGPIPGQPPLPLPPGAPPASPIPPSPLSNSRSDERSAYARPGPPPLGAGRPPLHLQPVPPSFDPARRAVSGPALSIARPERNASMTQHGYPAPSPIYANGQVVQSPASSDFHHPNGSQGLSPYPRDPYGQPDYRQPGSIGNGGRQSPYGPQGPFPQSDFGQYAPPHANGAYPTYPHGGIPRSQSDSAPPAMARPDSRQSNGSYSSGRTDNSGRWGAPPPPMPKERSFNGMDFSGRGGPLYATSLRGEPGQGQGGYLAAPQGPVHRSRSADGLRSEALRGAMGPSPNYRAPSQALLEERSTSAPGSPRSASKLSSTHGDVSPPTSPVEPRIPDKTSVVATMRCKVFLQQHHAQWKSLGTAKLKLFQSMPSNTKQLVVDSDKGGGKTIISTIVLADGVERVGKTGVAVDLSDQGQRTGIIYMLQLRTEQSATGLFEQLLLGTDRAGR
ncbi:hypothetical protein JCM10296v2_004345 [Rhodotorula toruloides]